MLSFQCFNISMCKIINIVENYNSNNNNKIINVNYFWFLLLICRFISTCICMRYFFDRRCNLNTKGEKHTLTHSTKESKNKNHSDDDWFDSIFNRVLFAPICFYFQFLSGINKSSSSSNRHNNNSKKVGNFWFVSNKTCAVIHPSPNCSSFFRRYFDSLRNFCASPPFGHFLPNTCKLTTRRKRAHFRRTTNGTNKINVHARHIARQ